MKSKEILAMLNDGSFDLLKVFDALLIDGQNLIAARRCGVYEAIKSCYLEQATKFVSAFDKFEQAGGKPTINCYRFAIHHEFNKKFPDIFQKEIAQESLSVCHKQLAKLFEVALKRGAEQGFFNGMSEEECNFMATEIAIRGYINLHRNQTAAAIEANSIPLEDALPVVVELECENIKSFSCEGWVKFEPKLTQALVTEALMKVFFNADDKATEGDNNVG